MRVPHYLTRGPSGRFYVRFRMPGDLRDTLGLTVIKRATGTMCPRPCLGLRVRMAGSAMLRLSTHSAGASWA